MHRVSVDSDHTQTHIKSVGLLWTRDRPIAETPTSQQTTFIRRRHSWTPRDSNPQYQHARDQRPKP